MVLGIVAGAFFRQNLEGFRVEGGAVFAKTPRGHVFGLSAANGNDDVREKRPRVVQIVLRRPRGMIGMRMVEPEEIRARFGRATLGLAVVPGTDEEASPRPLFSHVGQREGGSHHAVPAVERATAFIRVRLGTM